MAERVIIVVQARLGSTRLPGKVLADLGGRPILAHVMARAAAVRGIVPPLVLTTPPDDAETLMRVAGAAIATRAGVALDWCEHRPPDLLLAFTRAAETRRADVVVRLTADCPLLAPDLIQEALALRVARPELDYIALLDLPGTDVEVMTARGLALANRRDVEREHVGQAVLDALLDSYGATWAIRPAQPDSPWLAVDTPADLARVRLVHAALEDPTDYSVTATLRAWERAGRP